MQALSPRSRQALLAWSAVICAAGVLYAIQSAPVADARTEDSAPGGDASLGAQLYASSCAQCHAADGRGAEVAGTGRMAPALAGRDLGTAYVDLVLRTGRMPPPEENPFDNQARQVVFDEEERAAIVAYTAQQFGLEQNIDPPPPGDPARGQDVYATNCAACHGSTGAGGVAGGGAWTPALTHYDDVTIWEAIRVGPFQMPAFDVEQISDQEAGDVAAFLDEVEQEGGTPILGLVELNPVFASGFVALMSVALLFSLLWISGRPTWFPDPEAERDRVDDADEGQAT